MDTCSSGSVLQCPEFDPAVQATYGYFETVRDARGSWKNHPSRPRLRPGVASTSSIKANPSQGGDAKPWARRGLLRSRRVARLPKRWRFPRYDGTLSRLSVRRSRSVTLWCRSRGPMRKPNNPIRILLERANQCSRAEAGSTAGPAPSNPPDTFVTVLMM